MAVSRRRSMATNALPDSSDGRGNDRWAGRVLSKTPSEKEGMIDPPDVGQAATIGWHET
jgi:hypothetical protein